MSALLLSNEKNKRIAMRKAAFGRKSAPTRLEAGNLGALIQRRDRPLRTFGDCTCLSTAT